MFLPLRAPTSGKNILTLKKKRSAANRISLIAEQQQEPQLEFQQKHVLTTEKKKRKEKDVSGNSFFFKHLGSVTLSLSSLQALPFKHM